MKNSCRDIAVIAVFVLQKGICRYGKSMQYVKMVLRCHAHMARGIGKCVSLVSGMLGRAGDNCFHITQDWAHVEMHRMDYEEKSEIDRALETEMRQDMPDNEYPYGRSNRSVYF